MYMNEKQKIYVSLLESKKLLEDFITNYEKDEDRIILTTLMFILIDKITSTEIDFYNYMRKKE